jgi:starch-binding outer membrane protein, SusD/RagB family
MSLLKLIIKQTSFFAGVILFVASCSKSEGFLENKTTALDEAQVFSDSLRTIQFLNGIYGDIGYSFNKGRWDTHGNTEQSVDDAEYTFSSPTRPSVMLYQATLNAANLGATSPTMIDFWTVPYTNIRRCNLMLAKLPTSPLSASMQARMKGEAKCLRAWYYMQLLIVYGGVPNVGDNIYTISDAINLPRSNFADLVAYIVKDLDEAQQLLPAPKAAFPAGYDALDYGRVTKGTAMGLKSRLLLYAASPLFNGGSIATTDTVKKVVSYPTYDVKHWQDAADAAQAVINSGYYSLVVDNSQPGLGFYKLFLSRLNDEIIFGRYRNTNKDFEGYYNPPTRSGANYNRATQDIVDAFPMINGKDIKDQSAGYNQQNPYVNRDPRFRYTIIYNGSKYATNSNTQDYVWTFTGTGETGDKYVAGTNTGYYIRKMCDSTVAQGSSAVGPDRPWPLMRYAEILLNYAEAINETGQTQLAYPKLTELRNRAGILPGADGLYGMKPNMTQAEMRAFIQNERRIELAYEDHRWNDIRRWKIAMTLYNGLPRGYNRVMHPIRTGGTAPANYTFNYVIENTIREHVFRPEMYLLPIPDQEIRKMPAMVQNPGW